VNVLSLMMGADTGGVSVAIAKAFRDVPGWDVRSIASTDNYIRYDTDLPWSAVSEQWTQADVIHLHHSLVGHIRLTNGWKSYRLPVKPYVVEFHGTGYRENPDPLLDEMQLYNAIGVVSTLDLWLIAPTRTEWLPCPINVERLRAMKQPSTDRILICHAPTNREIKSTAVLLKAVKRLQDEGLPVDLDLIEHRPWAECLERKARADIYFDQVILGYGCNALEAWGMGIPVVAGAADDTLDEMERRFGVLPFYHATEETIYDALREMVESPELRKRYGQIGHDYVRKYHDEPVVVEQLKAIYQRAVGQESKAA